MDNVRCEKKRDSQHISNLYAIKALHLLKKFVKGYRVKTLDVPLKHNHILTSIRISNTTETHVVTHFHVSWATHSTKTHKKTKIPYATKHPNGETRYTIKVHWGQFLLTLCLLLSWSRAPSLRPLAYYPFALRHRPGTRHVLFFNL